MAQWRVWLVLAWLAGLLLWPGAWPATYLWAYVGAGLLVGTGSGALRPPGGWPWQRKALAKRLDAEALGGLPDEVAGPAPRRDVFSGMGHLRDAGMAARWLPLLVNGEAYRALCTARTERREDGHVHVKLTYAWKGAGGQVHEETLEESYAPDEVKRAPGTRPMVVDVDAGVMLGRAFTVMQEPKGGRHVVLEAVLAWGWVPTA